jgi:hypothetical protein
MEVKLGLTVILDGQRAAIFNERILQKISKMPAAFAVAIAASARRLKSSNSASTPSRA